MDRFMPALLVFSLIVLGAIGGTIGVQNFLKVWP
jgi:hypothetical protein